MNEPTICDYANDGRRITAPGKFEGQPVFAPYLWDLGLQGFADLDDGTTYGFKLTPADFEAGKPFAVELKAWLGRRRVIRLSEDSQGFIRCH